MRKLKDFFYNKNDIIIVLIILAVAAFIIYSRIGVIMDYPEKLADNNETVITQEESTPTLASDETETTQESTVKSTSTSKKDSEKDSKTVSVKLTNSDTSVTVAEKLANAGIVESATEFEGYITNMDKADSIKSGTFKIKKGSSYETILNTITK